MNLKGLSLIRKNLISNFAGSLLVGAANIAVLPFYLKLLGAESYGLVGFYVALIGMLAVLDLGLSSTLSRELAMLSVSEDGDARMGTKVRTLECFYWLSGLFVALLIVLLAKPISAYVNTSESLSKQAVSRAVTLMGIVIGLKWPSAMYIGGLLGLQKHFAYNSFNVMLEFGKLASTILCLVFIGPTIYVFFTVQAVYYLIYSLAFASLLWRYISDKSAVYFSWAEFREMWRFASGIAAISVVSVILVQVDKVLLIRILPLSLFGYYTLAFSIASGLYRIIGPIDQTFYPKIVQLVRSGNNLSLKDTYHRASQSMAVAILPLGLFVSFFAYDLIFLWTQSVEISANVASIVSVLILGTSLHGLVFIPYALQLANGWTRFAFYQNLIAVMILIPAMYVSAKLYGALGAAWMWVLLNAGYVFISQPIMYRRLLVTEKKKWYIKSFLIPAILSAGCLTLFKLMSGSFQPMSFSRYCYLVCCLTVTYFLTALSTTSTRRLIYNAVKAF